MIGIILKLLGVGARKPETLEEQMDNMRKCMADMYGVHETSLGKPHKTAAQVLVENMPQAITIRVDTKWPKRWPFVIDGYGKGEKGELSLYPLKEGCIIPDRGVVWMEVYPDDYEAMSQAFNLDDFINEAAGADA